jgi:hypothetical protein
LLEKELQEAENAGLIEEAERIALEKEELEFEIE